jgi:hypothetical protein
MPGMRTYFAKRLTAPLVNRWWLGRSGWPRGTRR